MLNQTHLKPLCAYDGQIVLIGLIALLLVRRPTPTMHNAHARLPRTPGQSHAGPAKRHLRTPGQRHTGPARGNNAMICVLRSRDSFGLGPLAHLRSGQDPIPILRPLTDDGRRDVPQLFGQCLVSARLVEAAQGISDAVRDARNVLEHPRFEGT